MSEVVVGLLGFACIVAIVVTLFKSKTLPSIAFIIFPMILGSIYVTGGALIIGVPIGILMSIFMARFCPDRLHKVLKPIVDLLAGIPSIVYGFFGLVGLLWFRLSGSISKAMDRAF